MKPEEILLHDTEDTFHFVIPSAPDTDGQIDIKEHARGVTGCGGDGCCCSSGGDGGCCGDGCCGGDGCCREPG